MSGASGLRERAMQRRSGGAFLVRAALVVSAFLLGCGAASANVLVPAAFVVAEASLPFVPAILVIEAVIARRLLGLSAVRSMALALVANLVSAGLGLPLVAPLMILDVRGSLDATAFLLVLLSLFLCPLSIWVETRVARRVLRTGHAGQCASWSREANLASYGMVVGTAVAIILADMLFRSLGYY